MTSNRAVQDALTPPLARAIDSKKGLDSLIPTDGVAGYRPETIPGRRALNQERRTGLPGAANTYFACTIKFIGAGCWTLVATRVENVFRGNNLVLRAICPELAGLTLGEYRVGLCP